MGMTNDAASIFKRKTYTNFSFTNAGQIALFGTVILVTVDVSMGAGRHVDTLPGDVVSSLGLIGNMVLSLSILAAVWSKTSFALSLLRLMTGWPRILLWTVIVTTNIFMGANALFVWFRCAPAQKTWISNLEGTCWAPSIFPIISIIVGGKKIQPQSWPGALSANNLLPGYSALTDFILAFLPWKLVWALQMKSSEKFGVALAMSMGVLYVQLSYFTLKVYSNRRVTAPAQLQLSRQLKPRHSPMVISHVSCDPVHCTVFSSNVGNR
jgi:hypothetical protein